MTKYIMGSIHGNNRPDGTLDRCIDIYNDERFAIVNRTVSDEDLLAHANEDALWLVDAVRVDKKGHDFLICHPVRYFTKEEDELISKSWSTFYNLRNALFSAMTREEASITGEYLEEYGRNVLARFAHRYDLPKDNPEMVRNLIFDRLASGDLSVKELLDASEDIICSNPETAKLRPEWYLTLGCQSSNELRFVDVNNPDTVGAQVTVTLFSVNWWKRAFPDGLQITRSSNHLYVSLDESRFDFSLPDGLMSDPHGYRWGMNWELIATSKANGVSFTLGLPSSCVSQEKLDALLKLAGVVSLDGRYVPASLPDWRFDFERNEDKEEFRPNEKVTVIFDNGWTLQYPMSYMFKKYPGKCRNAKFSTIGSSLESLYIRVQRCQE